MKVRVNDQGYITDYAIIGDLPDSTEMPDPEDLEHFQLNFKAYTLSGYNADQGAAVKLQEQQEVYRQQRETECFAVINRGVLWYDELTAAQKAELKGWYQKWLDVTETMNVPVRPAWLK